jgi:hypothetical protein
MVEIIVTLDEISGELRMITERAGDFTAPITRILEDGLAAARQRFVTKGPGPSGETWAEPAPGTHYGPGESLLVRSGHLLDSLSQGGEDNIFEVTATEGQAGTGVLYAGFNVISGMRPFIGWTEDHFPAYDNLVLDHLVGEPASA